MSQRGSELTITAALTFVLAPLPNSICSRCARADEISPEFNSAYVDFGRFLTGMLVVSVPFPFVTYHPAPPLVYLGGVTSEALEGFDPSCQNTHFPSICKTWTVADSPQTTGLSLPVLLAHSSLIQPAACWMSIAGGALVYGTILVYSGWFGGSTDEDF